MSRISASLAKPVEISSGGKAQPTPVSQRASNYATRVSPKKANANIAKIKDEASTEARATSKHSEATLASHREGSNKRKRDEPDRGLQGASKMIVVENGANGLLQQSRTSQNDIDQLNEGHMIGLVGEEIEMTEAAGHASNPLPDMATPVGADGTQLDPAQRTSDFDWLRRKKNRTLDLLGDEERSPVSTTTLVDQPGIRAEAAPDMDDDLEERDDNQLLEPQVSNGRLFVRNLAFTATELDLNELFSKHGRVAEVSV